MMDVALTALHNMTRNCSDANEINNCRALGKNHLLGNQRNGNRKLSGLQGWMAAVSKLSTYEL